VAFLQAALPKAKAESENVCKRSSNVMEKCFPKISGQQKTHYIAAPKAPDQIPGA
jgi:hypothetical protein